MADVEKKVTTIKTRIRLRYDSLEQWKANNPVLLKGEVAVCFPAGVQADGKDITIMKIGDGTKKFTDAADLWANAADVPQWVKGLKNQDFGSYVFETGTEDGTVAYTFTDKNNKVGTKTNIKLKGWDELVSRVSELEKKVAALEAKPAVKVSVNGGEAIEQDKNGVIALTDIASKASLDTEIERAKGAEKTNADAITAEAAAARAAEQANATAIAEEQKRAEGVEATHAKSIEDINAKIGTLTGEITGVFHFKGTVATKADLDKITDPKEGDVYHVSDTHDEYVYAGIKETGAEKKNVWEVLGSLDLSGLNEKIKPLEDKVGNASDAAKADGSLYARIAQEIADRKAAITAVEGKIPTVDAKTIKSEAGVLSVGEIAQSQVTGLPAALAEKVKSISIKGQAFTVTDGAATLADGITEKMLSDDLAAKLAKINKVDDSSLSQDADGTLSVKAVSTDKIIQGANEFILDGGNSSAN